MDEEAREGDQARVLMPAMWPRSVWRCWPVVESQIFIVASADALAMNWPSGEYDTAETAFLWPWRMREGL